MSLKLEDKINDPQTLVILWDGEAWKKVYKPLFINELRKVPSDLPWEEFLQRFALLEEKIGKRYVVYLLSRRSYLSSDLEEKLLSKGFSREAARNAVSYCQEKGYLNDDQELARLVAKELRSGKSTKAVYYKLKQKKGMQEAGLQEALRKAGPSDEEALEKWLAKHARKIDRSDKNAMRKLAAKLLRQGFPADLVFARVVNKCSKDYKEDF